MNNQQFTQLTQLLDKLGRPIKDSNINAITEDELYKYIITENFAINISKIIKENNLEDYAFEYVEAARNIVKNTIYNSEEIILDLTKIIIFNALSKNGVQGILDILYDYSELINGEDSAE